MSDEEKSLLIQNCEDTKHLKKLAEELIYALKGGMGNEGLIERIKLAENERKMQAAKDNELKEQLIIDNDNFKTFVLQQLSAIEESMYKKFDMLDSTVELKFNEMLKFKKEVSEFKLKLETYMGLLTGRATWAFLFKAAAFFIGIGGLLYGFWKVGYDSIIKFIKYIF